jgi:hypothetical protein
MLAASDNGIDHIADVLVKVFFRRHFLCLSQQGHLVVTVKAFIGVIYGLLLLNAQARASQAAFIHAAYRGRVVAADNQERRNVFVYAGHPGGITPFPYGDKLMKQDHAGKPHARLDFAVTAYLAEVADDDFVPENTVVADMGANHNKVVAPDFSEGVMVHTRVNSDLFANSVIVADYEAAEFRIRTKIEYLRFASDDTVGK